VKFRVVLDANILVSALIVKVGKPAQILEQAHQLELLISEEILSEVKRVLHYPRIMRRYKIDEDTISTYLESIRAKSEIVDVHTNLKIVQSDPDDDKFFACAVDGKADYIVSGDPHLLTIQEYQGIRVVSPAAFLNLLSTNK
jgi:uncharacterized protein